MYKLVCGTASNEDGESCGVYGVAGGGVAFPDVTCRRDLAERLVRALNDCMVPAELLWIVLENWADRHLE